MMTFRPLAMFLALLGLGPIGPLAAADLPKPVKVFILAGQSNMEGQAVADLDGKNYNNGKGTLKALLNDPVKAPLVKHLVNDQGGWTIRDDVWVRYKREKQPLLAGPLTMGYAVYGGTHHFGPELQFGHVVGDHLPNQVLLIKTAWGGKSLYKDFRPPSSGGEVGPYYTKMIADIREALANLKTEFPGYAGQGYELAGFVWYHGWNDGVDPKKAVPEYEQNLVNLIKDVRQEFKSPKLPVVVGELTGPWVDAPGEWATLRKAQAAAAARPEFRGNVLFVPTRDFVRPANESPNPGHGHHEFGNAETYFLVGDALAKGMVKLLTEQSNAKPEPAKPAVNSVPRPMNIVLLYADDWRHDTLGCAGHPILKTPHLDALAKDGVRFTHSCVTTSICGVSRASLLTGQWMSRHGNPAFAMFKTPWAETFPGMLREQGYWVGHVGKWHNGPFPKDRYDFGRSYAGTHWIKRPNSEPVHVTQLNESDSLEFLRTRPKDKPFCLTVSFFAAHAEDGNPKQYLPQPGSAELYANDTIPVPALATDEALKRLPPFLQKPENEGRKRWTWRFDTPEKYQTMMKNYYRLCTEVDTACGRVIAELKTQGVFDNTLVIFTGDNGYFHGERGLADKWYPYEESIRVPLIVHDPRMPTAAKGQTNGDFVLNVDLAPTILGGATLNAPQTMQGRDLSVLYREASKPNPPWRDEFFYEHAIIGNKDRIPASQALVRHDAKYIYWPDFQYEEFFDLTTDPHEQKNLMGDPTRAKQLTEMKQRFETLKTQAR